MHREFRQRALDLLMMDREPLALDRFWVLVDAIAWRDPHAPHEERLAGAGLREVVLAELRLSELYVALYDRLDGWRDGELRREVGANELFALATHLVGLGREEYDAALRDPARVAERGRRGDFRDGFSFVFPRALDRFPDDAVRTELIAAYVPREWIDGERWRKNTVVRHEQWGLGIVDMGALKGVRVIFEGTPRILPGLKPYGE